MYQIMLQISVLRTYLLVRWYDDEFLFLTERPLFAAFILLLLRPFLLLEQIEGSLIVMHQKFKRGFDLQKGLRK